MTFALFLQASCRSHGPPCLAFAVHGVTAECLSSAFYTDDNVLCLCLQSLYAHHKDTLAARDRVQLEALVNALAAVKQHEAFVAQVSV